MLNVNIDPRRLYMFKETTRRSKAMLFTKTVERTAVRTAYAGPRMLYLMDSVGVKIIIRGRGEGPNERIKWVRAHLRG